MKEAWKKVLEAPENPTKQESEEQLGVLLFFGFLILGAIVGVVKLIFWGCWDFISNLFAKIFKRKKESSK